jgi:YrhK-like protein
MNTSAPMQEFEDLNAVQKVARDYESAHMALGIAGNAMFFVGSIFFLFEPLKTAGVWLFIIGSFGMLVGSVGSKILKSVHSS